jgi:hypothetical protein
MAFKALKYELVELVIPGVGGGQTGTRWNFPDLPKLRYTSLQAATIFTAGTLTLSPLGNAIMSTTRLAKAYITFYANERQDLYRIPLLEMNHIQNSVPDAFSRQLFEFAGQKVTWEKTYIEFGSAPGNTANESILLGVYYA